MCFKLEFHRKRAEDFKGLFLIAYHHLDSDLHDNTKDTITLVCQFIQSYFEYFLTPYKPAILSSYKTK